MTGPKIDALCTNKIREVADNMFSYYKSTMYELAVEWRAGLYEFIARQEQVWGKCFVTSEAMHVIAAEAAEQYAHHINDTEESAKDGRIYMLQALCMIYARACQVFLEIFHLVRLGFADGAFARWRTMYELSVVAHFIRENGEEVAKSYVEAADTENRYEWARKADCLSNEKKKFLNFEDIQKKSDFASKETYSLASKLIHASPQGTFNRISVMGAAKGVPIGHSDYGAAIPAVNSAISLAQIASLYLGILPHNEGDLNISLLCRWTGVVKECYCDTHKEAFGEVLCEK